MSLRIPDAWERFRLRQGRLATSPFEPCGAFVVPHYGISIATIVSDGSGWPLPPPVWEHASVSLSVRRTPTWAEMHWVREQLWEPEDTVLQLHPPASEYVNVHEHVLHLWRPIGVDVPRPPRITV